MNKKQTKNKMTLADAMREIKELKADMAFLVDERNFYRDMARAFYNGKAESAKSEKEKKYFNREHLRTLLKLRDEGKGIPFTKCLQAHYKNDATIIRGIEACFSGKSGKSHFTDAPLFYSAMRECVWFHTGKKRDIRNKDLFNALKAEWVDEIFNVIDNCRADLAGTVSRHTNPQE